MKDWHLDPGEVSLTGTRPYSKRKGSPDLTRRGATLILTHMPTGVAVTGVIECGPHSRKKMAALREHLKADLYAQLERAVARHLRLPGQ